MRRPMTRHKGAERFRKQCRAILYNMSTSAGARDGMRWQEYAANVKAQRGFTTRQLEQLRRLWEQDKRPPGVLNGFMWMKGLDWGNYLSQTRAAWAAYKEAAGHDTAARWPRRSRSKHGGWWLPA